MNGNLRSYETNFGTRFWRDHPYQWVGKAEAESLLGCSEPDFTLASEEEIIEWYAI
jgi:hypothetical protein